jgi:hypothetical protein
MCIGWILYTFVMVEAGFLETDLGSVCMEYLLQDTLSILHGAIVLIGSLGWVFNGLALGLVN